MRFHDVDQNTDEWLDLRCGKLTGSAVGSVMANFGKAFGEPAKKLAIVIACEQVTGKRSLIDSYSNAHMERGHEQEPLARGRYEEEFFCTVSKGGFFESGMLGCSPDGLVFDDGLIEIKSVIAPVHFANISRANIDPSYKWQIYFNLMVTERKWLDFVSFCPDFPEQTRLFTHRVMRDDCDEHFKKLNIRMAEFFQLVEESKLIIRGESSWQKVA